MVKKKTSKNSTVSKKTKTKINDEKPKQVRKENQNKSWCENALAWKITSAILLVMVLILGYFAFSTNCPEDKINGEVLTSDVIILNDARCVECAIEDALVPQLNQVFGNLEIENVDYMSEEGKLLYEETRVTLLPAILFTDKIKENSVYTDLTGYFTPAGKYLSLAIGATHDPTKEICNNNIDDTGNGLVDCEDPDCKNTLVCNPDALADCVADFGLTPDTVLFIYSETCPWCSMMKPGVQQLVEEGYNIRSVSNTEEDMALISSCLSNYMSGSVPEFICAKTVNIRTGAFTDSNQKLDLDAMRNWIEECVA